jgi:hypothetical protein
VQAELQHQLGSLSEAQGRPDKAREHYEQAAALSRQCGDAPKLELAQKALERVRESSAPA